MTIANMLRAEPLKGSVFFLLALMFLSANVATDKHVTHGDVAKFITVDHQVRRDLSRAERENLKTSVVSGKGEFIPNPPQEALGVARAQEIAVIFYPVSHSVTQLQRKSIFLDSSPVLNL